MVNKKRRRTGAHTRQMPVPTVQEPSELATAGVEILAGLLGWVLFWLSLILIMNHKPYDPDSAWNIGAGMLGLFITIPATFIGGLFFGRAGDDCCGAIGPAPRDGLPVMQQ